MLRTLKVKAERTEQAAAEGYLLATDIADYLVKKGVPFRQAHELVGKLVRYALEQGKDLKQLTLDEYKRFSPLFDADVLFISVESSIAGRNIPGGTAPEQVDKALAEARQRLAEEG